MQKLHLVGFTAEHDGLIFSLGKGSSSDEFVVDLSGELLQTIAEAERRRDRRGSVDAGFGARQQPRSGHTSELSPRELQDRLRAGWSIEEVAREAGTDVEWVSRFAAPVRAEQARVVDRALGLTFDKARLGPSSLPLGRSVLRNLGGRGVRLSEEEVDSAWSAFQLEEGLWVVRFSYTSRGRAQEAEWLFDVDTGELSARNRLASQLGHVAKGRARQPLATTTSPPARRRPSRSAPGGSSPAAGGTVGAEADAAGPAEG
ncbi:MAG: septation protein SepH, partial [Actinomycetota bacterium]|nr:septation protein SepH [Actinomycetota bacterium]